MKTKQTNTLAAAVAAVVNPQAKKAQDKALSRINAFVDAYFGLAHVDQEARSAEASAWSTYVEGVGAGATPDALRDALYSQIAQDAEESGENLSDVKKAAGGRCKNYKRRVDVLLAHRVALVDAKGAMVETCTVQFKGETFAGALGAVAQRLLKAGAETRKPRQTSGAQEGEEGEEGTTDGKVDHKVVSGADVPLDAPLIERVCSWLASDTPEGEAARSANEDAITRAAELIALKRLNAQAIREAQAKARAERKARAESKARASAAQVVVEAAQSAAAVQ